MRAVVQRVAHAEVRVDSEVVGKCGKGYLLLVAAHREDSAQNAAKMADKVFGLRILSDEEGKMNLALKDLMEPEREVLAVSNFTVYGDTVKNRRPSFIESAPFEQGKELFDLFVDELRRLGCKVETGLFGAHMDVELVNDGPVTVIVDA